ncbi:MAG TPA: tyrosine-type recombinase/integrase [Syntrophomonadaceae bacterium]|nr:tyrosine-type recombinase/integrase [Syntrophomonadaceae bacterium]
MAKGEKRKVGSYEWRGKDSVRLTVRAGTDPETGEPLRPTKTVKVKPGDERAAEKALARFVTEVETGKYKKPSKMTVKQLSERFLRDNPDLSDTTRHNYELYLNGYILPAMGHKKIDKVHSTNLYDYYNNLKEDGIRKDGKPGGFSPATIQKHHNIISSMFTFAVKNLKELKKDQNPCKDVTPVKIPRRKKASLDKAPARDLLRALEKESLKYRVMTVLDSATGMRRGEILGIGDSTLDLENCVIKVIRASTFIPKEEITIGDPKTETSIRFIPFHKSIIPLLQEMIAARNKQREKCGDKWVKKVKIHGEWVDNDLLFTQWNGKPMHPNSIDTWFRKFREENGFPESLKFHGLRHTNIHLLLKAGADLETVMGNAGHADSSTTIDYDDPDAEALRELANKINDALSLESIVPELLGKPVNIRRKRTSPKEE